jgi:hypothetical protein
VKIYAVYRCLYGEDFVQASIRSIDNVVDRIFIFWDDRPWGDTDHAIYKGQRVDFPKPPMTFDNVVQRVHDLNNPKVVLQHDHLFSPSNQFTHFVNDLILPHYEMPDCFMFIEVDQVFRPDQLARTMEHVGWKQHCMTRQVEVWKGLRHRVPERNERTGVCFWMMDGLDQLPKTGAQGDACPHVLDTYVHNFGFAVSERVMFWKHMTALAFSHKIGDGLPNESWLEQKWLNWTPDMTDLEISAGCERAIPHVVPYDPAELPPL